MSSLTLPGSRTSTRTRTSARPRRQPRLTVIPLEDRAVPAASFVSAVGLGGAYDERAGDLAVDATGNTYVSGAFQNYAGAELDFDPGTDRQDRSDILVAVETGDTGFVAKYSPAGDFLWVRQVGNSLPRMTADGAGNFYVTGIYNGTAASDPIPGPDSLARITGSTADQYVMKLRTDGGLEWARGVGTSGWSTEGTNVAVDGAGNVVTVGVTYKTGSNSPDFVVTRHDAAGNLLWSQRVGGTGSDRAWGVATDAGGNAYVTGDFVGSVDFDPGAGKYSLSSGRGYHASFVLKLTAAGAFGWARHFRTTSNSAASTGWDVAVSGTGDVYVAGGHRGGVDFDPGAGTHALTNSGNFVCKLTAAGTFAWVRSVGGDQGEPVSLALDATGGVYMAGMFQGTQDFDPGAGAYSLTSAGFRDLYAVKLDSTGAFQWAVRMGGAGEEYNAAIAVHPTSGEVHLAGVFSLTADFGGMSLSSQGETDLFLATVTQY